MDSQYTQILLLQATAIENWTQFIRTATIRSGCLATWTAYPSKALNVTWTPSSMRQSWMVDLWTLISTTRLQLMGFLRGWRPLHTAGCRARDIRWDWWLLWSESNLTTKMSPGCLIDEHFHSHTQGFILSINVSSTGSWWVKKWKHHHSANVMWHISSNSPMFVSILFKGLKPIETFLTCLSVCLKAGIKLDFKDTWRKPKHGNFVETPHIFLFFGLNVPVLISSLYFRRLSLQQPRWVSKSCCNGDTKTPSRAKVQQSMQSAFWIGS